MKSIQSFVLFALVCIGLAGCIASNPNYDKTQPVSSTNQPYVVDNKPQSYIATAQSVNNSVPTPYQPLINLGLGVIGGAITLGSSVIALMKNKQAATAQANADTQAAAAKHLASQIPEGQTSAVVNSAPTPQIASAVAAHLQSAV